MQNGRGQYKDIDPNAILKAIIAFMKSIFPVLICVSLIMTGCTTPKKIVAKRYQNDTKPRELTTIFQNELSSLVYAIGEDENCTYTDKYLLVKIPPKNNWNIMGEESERDCSKKEDALTQKEYAQWKIDQKSNQRIWRPGMLK